MKKWIGIFALAVLLFGCSDNVEQKAQERLATAKKAFDKGDYSEAKLQLDSIRLLYPKAFEARKQSIRLMQQVDLKEQQHTLAYLDSLRIGVLKEIEELKGDYVLEKSADYQDEGIYLVPSQIVEKTMGKTFLRAQVSENGSLTLTSILTRRPIHHRSVKVIAGDSYAETPVSSDFFESKNVGMISEKVDYQDGADGGVIAFIVANQNEPIKVEYIGDTSTVTVTMTQDEKKAIARILTLAKRLKAEQEIQKDIKQAKLKMEFITRKMNDNGGEKN